MSLRIIALFQQFQEKVLLDSGESNQGHFNKEFGHLTMLPGLGLFNCLLDGTTLFKKKCQWWSLPISVDVDHFENGVENKKATMTRRKPTFTSKRRG